MSPFRAISVNHSQDAVWVCVLAYDMLMYVITLVWWCLCVQYIQCVFMSGCICTLSSVFFVCVVVVVVCVYIHSVLHMHWFSRQAPT